MGLRRKLTLYSGNAVAASFNSAAQHIGAHVDWKKFAGILNCLKVSGTTPTLDAKIQHSPDGLTGWKDFITFTQANPDQSAAPEMVHVTETAQFPFPYFRAVVTLGGTLPVYNISEITLWFGP